MRIAIACRITKKKSPGAVRCGTTVNTCRPSDSPDEQSWDCDVESCTRLQGRCAAGTADAGIQDSAVLGSCDGHQETHASPAARSRDADPLRNGYSLQDCQARIWNTKKASECKRKSGVQTGKEERTGFAESRARCAGCKPHLPCAAMRHCGRTAG